MPDRFEPDELITVLLDHGVDFVVIGGFAAVAHGSPRATFDLDVVADDDPNDQRLAEALASVHARIAGTDADMLDVDDPTNPDDLAAGASWTLTTDHGRLDVMAVDMVPGAPADTDLRHGAAAITTPAGNRIAVAGLAHLLTMKRSSGRDKDLADIAAILRTRELEAEQESSRSADVPGPPTTRSDVTSSASGDNPCGAWMPIARRHCGLSPGHAGQHR